MIVSDKKTKVYTPDERILMSSIVYLAFPQLINNLDYCLKRPEIDKNSKKLS